MGDFIASLDVKLCSGWRLAPVKRAQGASPYFGNGHIIVPHSHTTCLVRVKFDMRHQGYKALSVYALLLDPHPHGWGQFTSKSGIFLKNLVRNYRVECTELNIGASGACLDVKVCSTRLLSPGVFSSGNEHKNVSTQTTSPIRIKFGMRYLGNEALSDCASHLDPPL